MTVTPKEAAEFLKQKAERKQKETDSLYLKAKADAEKMIQHIIENYSPMKIYQWGSLLKKELFREYSDIDIAVEGITEPSLYFKLIGELNSMS